MHRTPSEIAAAERALLERIYALPSPRPRVLPSEPVLLLLWVSVALLSVVYVRGGQA